MKKDGKQVDLAGMRFWERVRWLTRELTGSFQKRSLADRVANAYPQWLIDPRKIDPELMVSQGQGSLGLEMILTEEQRLNHIAQALTDHRQSINLEKAIVLFGLNLAARSDLVEVDYQAAENVEGLIRRRVKIGEPVNLGGRQLRESVFVHREYVIQEGSRKVETSFAAGWEEPMEMDGVILYRIASLQHGPRKITCSLLPGLMKKFFPGGEILLRERYSMGDAAGSSFDFQGNRLQKYGDQP